MELAKVHCTSSQTSLNLLCADNNNNLLIYLAQWFESPYQYNVGLSLVFFGHMSQCTGTSSANQLPIMSPSHAPMDNVLTEIARNRQQ